MDRPRVLVTARSFGQFSPEPVNLLLERGCEVIRRPVSRPLSAAELRDLVPGMDALIVGNDEVDASVVEAARSLKVISRYGVGLDNIDLAAAAAAGIVVTNTPGTNDASVADLTMGLILALARHLPQIGAKVKAGGWGRLLGMELAGKVLGIAGLGRIGRGVARRASAFDLKILGWDQVRDEEWAARTGVTYVSWEELLEGSDLLTLHLPLTPSTRGLLGAAELARLKPGAYLINTARGELVEEQALYEALVSGRLAGAGLDVLATEPPGDSPLLQLENVLVTSHIGGYTGEAVQRMGLLAARNVLSVLAGERPQHAADQPLVVT